MADTPGKHRLKVYWANGTTNEWDFDDKPERSTTADGSVLVYEVPDGDFKVEIMASQALAVHVRELAE